MKSLVNVLDNKSREKNILINNVKESKKETSSQLTEKVKRIIKYIDNTILVTKAFRTGEHSPKPHKTSNHCNIGGQATVLVRNTEYYIMYF